MIISNDTIKDRWLDLIFINSNSKPTKIDRPFRQFLKTFGKLTSVS
jgi:hypothetical protein